MWSAHYDKYSDIRWGHVVSHQHSYLSDEVIGSVFQAINSYIHQSRKIPKQYSSFRSPLTLSTFYEMDRVLEDAQETLSSLSPRFDKVVKRADDSGHLHISPSQKTHGHGYCPNENIFWEFDHSINNPIYFSHEFGHRIGNVSEAGKPPNTITEWQAHFLQMAEYDRLIAQGDEFIKNGAFSHRHLEIVTHLYSLNKGEQAISALQSRRVIKPIQKNDLERSAQFIHYHPSAMFIAIALYDSFKKSSGHEKEIMLDALYNSGSDVKPEDILKAFDINGPKELTRALREALDNIGFRADQNFSPEPTILKML